VKVQIDLQNITNERELLREFGAKLELGGSDGNVHVAGINAGRGWGMNWDALADSLTCLDTGGIWGTSFRFEFPMIVELLNSNKYAQESAKDFELLVAVLRSTAEFYSKAGMVFKYELL
jgi:hypothetical protein